MTIATFIPNWFLVNDSMLLYPSISILYFDMLCINSDFLDVSIMVLELKVAIKMWFLQLKSLLLVVVHLSVPSLPDNEFGAEMSFVGLPSILMLGT